MKNIKTYLLIGLLSISFSSIETFAQSLDANRMNRDIKIMENILGELFKTQAISGSSETIIIDGANFFSSSNIRGTYLPGFGLIFKVAGSNSRNIQLISSAEGGNYSFYYDSDDKAEDRSVDEESVKERITEFLKDYASTIGQLKPDEKVMVIYGSKNNSSRFPGLVVARGKNHTKEEKEELPVISISVKVSDLKDYRTGKLTAAKLEDKLAIATSKDKEYLDLKVMSNIFETALKEQEGEAFRLSGGINYLMLDNFGALFSFDVRFSSARRGNAVWSAYDALTPRMHGQSSSTVVSGTARATLDKEKEELDIKVEEAYSVLISNVKEYVIDYGRTLNSLSSDQFLLLSVTINGRYSDIPERIDIQVKKSVLEQVDRGSLSREKALQQVIVTEY